MDFIRLGKEALNACTDIGLDYAVAELTKCGRIMLCDIGRPDVGGVHYGRWKKRMSPVMSPMMMRC